MRTKKRSICGIFLLLYVLSPTAFAAKTVIPSGMPVGVRMTAKGVVVCGMNGVQSAAGAVCPAEEAGLKTGDILYTVNGEDISSSEELANAVQQGDGNEVVLEGERDGVDIRVTVTPVKSTADKTYHLGLLVRDSMAGIGTVTYVDPEDGSFGALGHAVCECDSGTKLPLKNGSLMPASVADVKKGKKGEPGELLGMFQTQMTLGKITKNTKNGIFGTMDAKNVQGTPVEVANASEVKCGSAQILTCVNGSIPKQYEIKIERVTGNSEDGKSMCIRVMDEELLEETGGIVQGMSGSPILQDGKLVGAVTHVLVNDPTRGYAVFAETMLDAAE
ncbi:MAG: SpoIVB peptidase [Butyricicoccus sp.]